jgi:hypothetical protein
MPINKQQLLSSASLLISGFAVLLISFQTMHGQVVAQEVGPGVPDKSHFSFQAWADPQLPTSPFYLAERSQEKLELMLMDDTRRPVECLTRSRDRLASAEHSWHKGYYAPTMVTLHKGFVYLHQAAHTWPSDDYSALTPVADAYVNTLDNMIANGFSDSQKSELKHMRERVEIIRGQFGF